MPAHSNDPDSPDEHGNNPYRRIIQLEILVRALSEMHTSLLAEGWQFKTILSEGFPLL